MSPYIGRREGPPAKLPDPVQPDRSARAWVRVALLIAVPAMIYFIVTDEDNAARWLPPDTAALVTGYEEHGVRSSRDRNRDKRCNIQINGDTLLYEINSNDPDFGMGDSIFRRGNEPSVRFIDSRDSSRRLRLLHVYPTRVRSK